MDNPIFVVAIVSPVLIFTLVDFIINYRVRVLAHTPRSNALVKCLYYVASVFFFMLCLAIALCHIQILMLYVVFYTVFTLVPKLGLV